MRSVSALKANVESRSIQNALTKSDLSWRMIREENKEVVMERLQNILNLSEMQLHNLYYSTKQNDPNILESEIVKCQHSMNYTRDFVSKRMFGTIHFESASIP